MEPKADVTLRTLMTASPIRFLLLAIGPVVLAGGQLLNSYVYGLSPLVAVAFAVVMVAYSVLYTRFRLARCRLQRLEEVGGPTAD